MGAWQATPVDGANETYALHHRRFRAPMIKSRMAPGAWTFLCFGYDLWTIGDLFSRCRALVRPGSHQQEEERMTRADREQQEIARRIRQRFERDAERMLAGRS